MLAFGFLVELFFLSMQPRNSKAMEICTKEWSGYKGEREREQQQLLLSTVGF
jgi:hypothetical protein